MSNGDENKNLLEAYKLLCDRVTHEIQELYTIHRVFLLITGAILSLIAARFGSWEVHIFGGLIGLVLASFWYIAART